jgi:hypothetical protein
VTPANAKEQTMIRPTRQARTIALAVALWLPVSTFAIAPALLLFIKQMAQEAAMSMIKDTLLSGLSGMGCKGIALSNALAMLDRPGVPGGMPKLPAGGMPGMPAGGLPGMPEGGLPGLGGMPTMTGMPPEMMAKMSAMLPGGGQLPPGMAMDPDQIATIARMQQAMNQPLAVPETLATIDELFELGFMPPAIQTEFKQCMLLVPATIPALGMGMGLLKPMIPQLRQARDEMRALSPAEQDELAAALAQELKALPADERAALVEQLDAGFFPARVGQGVKARLSGR